MAKVEKMVVLMVSLEYKDRIRMIVLENYVLMCDDKEYNSPKRMRQSRA